MAKQAIAMLELILKLLDNLRMLLELRDKEHLAAFQDHVEPIYRDIKAVYDDYLVVFKVTRDGLLDDKVPLASIIAQLKSRRDTNQRLRQELVAYSEALKSSKRFPSDFSNFCNHISWIIQTEPTDLKMPAGPATTQITGFISFLEEWSGASSRRPGSYQEWPSSELEFRQFAAARLDSTINALTQHWQLAMNAYFELRVKYLKAS